MEPQYVLSIDIGTSSCKTFIFDIFGNVVCKASKEHKTNFEQAGAVDQDPEEWWNGVVQTVNEVLEISNISKNHIAVIGIDTQSSVMIPISREGKKLHNAIIWTDRRSTNEKSWIDRNVGQDQLTRINGNQNDESNLAPKILWFKNQYRSLYKDTYKILNAAGYIVYRLTGKYSCNISEGGMSQIFDIESGKWSKELVDACEIDMEKLPEIYQCSDVVGSVTKAVADQLGLYEGLPVVAGSMDVVACALGCGIIEEGDAFITGGTVTALGVCTDKPVRNISLHVYHHIIPNKWCNVAGIDYGGGNFRWFRDKFMQHYDIKSVYAKMDEMAERVPAGSDKLLFLPSLVGQRCPQWDGDMKGVFFGITPNHGIEHFIRALMEGNAFAAREIVELLEKEGAMVKKLVIAGGIAKSNIWMSIFEDVIGKPLFLAKVDEATALGNMINAAYGVGLVKTYKQEVKHYELEQISFSQSNHDKYNKLYPIYKELYPSLKEQFKKISELQI